MGLEAVRTASVLVALVAALAAIHRRDDAVAFLQRFWLEPSSPVNVALLRMVIFGLITRAAFGRRSLWYAGLPAEERDPPPGWEWVGASFFDADVVAGARIGLIVAGTAATLGVFTRMSAPVAALLAVYVFGIPSFFAKIDHGGHLRMQCALAIAFAPCGHALSVDRLIGRWRGTLSPPASAAYTIPVRAVWVLVGLSYFFPGFWKLWESGDLWLSGRQPLFELRSKWARLPDFEPLFRIDQHAWLLVLFGTATLIFELGYVFALGQRTARTVAALSSTLFHLGVAALLDIRFPAFFPLIVLLEIPERSSPIGKRLAAYWRSAVDAWNARAQAWRKPRGERSSEPAKTLAFRAPALLPVALAAATLVGAQCAAGFARLNSWPISVFPTFSRGAKQPPRVGSMLLVRLESESEEPIDLAEKLRHLGTVRLERLLRGLDERHDGRGLVAVIRRARLEIDPADRIVLYEATWRVLPPGKRRGYAERAIATYRVTDDGTLETVDEADGEHGSERRSLDE
jgi:hypothetical protein